MKYSKEDEDVASKMIERFPTQDKRVRALFISSAASSVAFVCSLCSWGMKGRAVDRLRGWERQTVSFKALERTKRGYRSIIMTSHLLKQMRRYLVQWVRAHSVLLCIYLHLLKPIFLKSLHTLAMEKALIYYTRCF